MGTMSKAFALMTREERPLFAALVAVSLLVGLIETLGVVSVVPFVVLASDPLAVERLPWLTALRARTGLASPDALLVALGLGCFAVLCAGVALRTAAFYLMARFVRLQSVALQARLLAGHLARPYAWHRARNSADLAADVLSEVQRVVEGVLLGAMRLVTNGAVALCLTALLVVVDPVAALAMAGLLGAAYGGVFAAVRHRIARMGAARLAARRETFRIVQEAMEGLKTLKLLRLEARYVERFAAPARRAAAMQARVDMMRELPRGVLEALCFGGMLLLVVWILADRNDLRTALPALAVYALAGARLFPVLQRLYRAMASLRADLPALEALEAGLSGPAPAPPATPSARPPAGPRARPPAIALDGIGLRFAGAARPVLDGVDLRIEPGRTVALAGPSGSGKSTLVDVVLGLLAPDAGTVRIDGALLDARTAAAWQRSVGHVPQAVYLADATIAENVAFGVPPESIDRAAVAHAARRAGLAPLVEGMAGGYDAPVGERGARLSGGQRQRVAIARALYREPATLVLDEPTSALDGDAERAVIDALDALGGSTTIVVATHSPALLRRADRVVVLADGRVAASAPEAPAAATHDRMGA